MLRRIVLFLAAALAAIAQTPGQPAACVTTGSCGPLDQRYIVTASTMALTVQQPAAGGNQVYLETASVYCASACTVTQSWNGAAATATAATILMLPGTYRLPLATAWSGSNAGSGTTGPVYNVAAGSTMVFDLSLIALGPTGGGSNFTLTASGAATITMQWRER